MTFSFDRSPLLKIIDQYQKNTHLIYKDNFTDQKEVVENFYKFVDSNPNCFSRENLEGHITGSSFVVNKNFTKVLFTYHAKLHRWLQLGGHADGEIIIQQVALKEAQEESGMEQFQFVDILNFPKLVSTDKCLEVIPFDLDIHLIPQRKNEPEHYHYDVRFILRAEEEDFKISAESLDLKWLELSEISNYTSEKSTLRQVKKLLYLLKNYY